MTNNLTKLPGGGKKDIFKNAIREMRESMETQHEYQEMTAIITRMKYEALRKQGFEHADAIELCRTVF